MNNFRRYSLRLLVAFFIIIYALWRLHRVNEDIRYTVATTTGQLSTPRNPSQIGYTFSDIVPDSIVAPESGWAEIPDVLTK